MPKHPTKNGGELTGEDERRLSELGELMDGVLYSDTNDYTPQKAAEYFNYFREKDNIWKAYKENRPVDDAPLRGEKYIDLLVKDSLNEALESGKTALSWTPSTMQHERYYGKNAMGRMSWELVGNESPPKIKINIPGGRHKVLEVNELDKNIGGPNVKALLNSLAEGKGEGSLDVGPLDLYRKTYDRAIPKAIEKLTGEKPRVGKTTDRDGKEVEVFYAPLGKYRERQVSGSVDEVKRVKKPGVETEKLLNESGYFDVDTVKTHMDAKMESVTFDEQAETALLNKLISVRRQPAVEVEKLMAAYKEFKTGKDRSDPIKHAAFLKKHKLSNKDFELVRNLDRSREITAWTKQSLKELEEIYSIVTEEKTFKKDIIKPFPISQLKFNDPFSSGAFA